MYKKHNKAIGFMGLSLAVALTAAQGIYADSDDDDGDSGFAQILEVHTNYADTSAVCTVGVDTLTLFGDHFDRKSKKNKPLSEQLKVTFGEQAELAICSATANEIVVECPAGQCTPGDYLLTVNYGKRFKHSIDYDLTVGAVGPQGEAGAQGEQGPEGPQGEAGPQGLQGEAGPQGLQGEIGPQGPKGDTGDTGNIGPIGLTGAQGIQGEAGPQGLQGEAGPQGLQGEIGPQGPKGDTGDTGNTGPIGLTGAQGIQGEVGPQGLQGEAGPQGLQGEIGPEGPKGDTGNTGPIGPIGPAGPPGTVSLPDITQAIFGSGTKIHHTDTNWVLETTSAANLTVRSTGGAFLTLSMVYPTNCTGTANTLASADMALVNRFIFGTEDTLSASFCNEGSPIFVTVSDTFNTVGYFRCWRAAGNVNACQRILP